MIGLRAYSLPVHDLQPCHVREQLMAFTEYPAVAAVQIYLLSQRVGNLHVPAIAPELRIVTLRGMVMQDDEIPDALVFELRFAIELGNIQRTEPRSGKNTMSLAIMVWIRWMLVDSRGSMKPLASPTAMQFLFQASGGRYELDRTGIGGGRPSRFASSTAVASSSLMCRC